MPLQAFVSNDGSNEIQVVDLASRSEVRRIAVPPCPFGIALTPDNLQLWVPVDCARAMAVICTPTGTVLRQIPLHDSGLAGVVMAPDGGRAYGLSLSGVLYVFDVPAMSVTAVRGLGGENTERMGLTPDGQELWVLDEGGGTVLTISTADGRVSRRLSAARFPADVAFTPDGRKAYIPDLLDDAVAVVDCKSGEVVRRIPVGSPGAMPRAAAVSPDGKQLYVALYEADRVVVIDTGADKVTGALTGRFDGPNGIALSPDGSLAVVANQAGQQTSIIDLATGAEVAALPFPGAPRRVAVGAVPAFERRACVEEASAGDSA